MRQTYYIVDTNVLLDYPDIIPNGTVEWPREPSVDLTNAHIVIPHKVLEELDGIRHRDGITTERARMAFTIIKRLCHLSLRGEEYDEEKGIEALFSDAFNLEHPIVARNGKQFIHILSTPKDFIQKNPMDLERNDMDGKILLTAEYVKKLTKKRWWQFFKRPSKVVFLTSDNCFTVRAISFGIKTLPYRYKTIDKYTGRRDLEVPQVLIKQFVQTGYIPRSEWEIIMSEQPPLVMNEFIVMHGIEPFSLFEHIGRYDAERDAIVKLQYASSFWPTPTNPGQAIYAEALYNPKFEVVLCQGAQGSGKTFMSSVFSYRACLAGHYSKVLVSTRDTGDSKLGALPGGLEAKMFPASRPFIDALRNYFTMLGGKAEPGLKNPWKDNSSDEIEKIITTNDNHETVEKPKKTENNKPKSLQGPTEEEEINAKTGTSKGKSKKTKEEKEEEKTKKREKKLRQSKSQEASDPAIKARDTFNRFFETIPYEHMQGRDLARVIVLYDEFQCQTHKRAENLLSRFGKNSKMIIMGDCGQTEEGQTATEENNGLLYASYIFKLTNYLPIVQVSFLDDEIVRHPFVTAILKVIKNLQKHKTAA